MRTLLVCALVLILASCATQTWTPKCRHDAIYVMATVGEEYETRAVYGFMGKDYHVEVQAKIDDNWEYVTYEYGQMIKVDDVWAFRPEAYVEPEEYFNSTLRWMNEGRKERQEGLSLSMGFACPRCYNRTNLELIECEEGLGGDCTWKCQKCEKLFNIGEELR